MRGNQQGPAHLTFAGLISLRSGVKYKKESSVVESMIDDTMSRSLPGYDVLRDDALCLRLRKSAAARGIHIAEEMRDKGKVSKEIGEVVARLITAYVLTPVCQSCEYRGSSGVSDDAGEMPVCCLWRRTAGDDLAGKEANGEGSPGELYRFSSRAWVERYIVLRDTAVQRQESKRTPPWLDPVNNTCEHYFLDMTAE